MPNRTCYHADESFYDTTTSKYQLIRIDEGEAGYLPVDLYTTLTEAQAAAKTHNTQLGLSDDDVLDIRASSMAAHNRQNGN